MNNDVLDRFSHDWWLENGKRSIPSCVRAQAEFRRGECFAQGVPAAISSFGILFPLSSFLSVPPMGMGLVIHVEFTLFSMSNSLDVSDELGMSIQVRAFISVWYIHLTQL